MYKRQFLEYVYHQTRLYWTLIFIKHTFISYLLIHTFTCVKISNLVFICFFFNYLVFLNSNNLIQSSIINVSLRSNLYCVHTLIMIFASVCCQLYISVFFHSVLYCLLSTSFKSVQIYYSNFDIKN